MEKHRRRLLCPPSKSDSLLVSSYSLLLLPPPPTPMPRYLNTTTHHLLLPAILFFFLLLFHHSSSDEDDLSFGFYTFSCPNAEFLVRNVVHSSSGNDPTLPGKLLRLLFHDCMVEGCDASVLLKGNGTERGDPANRSLGGFEVIDSAKRVLELFCPGVVSCADIVVLAARDAVDFSGGPTVPVRTGRRDGRISMESNVRPNIIDTSFTMDEMIDIFKSKGLSLHDLVTLSGAHTIGSSHCSSFRDRFEEGPSGKLESIDTLLDKAYASDLAHRCPAKVDPSVTVSNDPETSSRFDNQYFLNLLNNKGLFDTDSLLVVDERSKGKVEAFAADQDNFFRSWSESFVKLSSIGVKTGEKGEVRRSCTEVNADKLLGSSH